jgi:photosystem II stability/assembly factor-like uncharacterized protein
MGLLNGSLSGLIVGTHRHAEDAMREDSINYTQIIKQLERTRLETFPFRTHEGNCGGIDYSDIDALSSQDAGQSEARRASSYDQNIASIIGHEKAVAE